MIYQYTDIKEYLIGIFNEKKKRNPLFSLRSWSRFLGYNSPSYISQVLAGERTVNAGLVESICASEGLTEQESHYLHWLQIKQHFKGPQLGDIYHLIEGKH